jgi:hypothetical protein
MGTKCRVGVATRFQKRAQVVALAMHGRRMTRGQRSQKRELDEAVALLLRHPIVAWRVPARTTESIRTRVDLRRLLPEIVPRLRGSVGKRKGQIFRRMAKPPLTSLRGKAPKSDLFDPVSLKKVT